jgi:hypothetical protein
VGDLTMVNLLRIDLGLSSAEEYWTQVVLPDFDEFTKSQSARDAIHSVSSAWHLHEWVFREQHPAGTKDDLRQFQEDVFKDCPELGWLRDYAETVKHFALGRRNIEVKKVSPDHPISRAHPIETEYFRSISFVVAGKSPVTLLLNDGTTHQLCDVLRRVIEYWRTKWFPNSP